jgi:hypothetical protein
MKRPLLVLTAVLYFAVGLAGHATAGPLEVQVGYADDLRPSPFFPIPWDGGSGVALFAGDTAGKFDSGAVRLINNGITPVTINSLTVKGFGNGASFTLWDSILKTAGHPAGFVLNPGESAIFAQTSPSENFDTSDLEGGHPLAIPEVDFTIDGVLMPFFDTAQVLNTEGTDHLGANGLNESHQWRDIGTTGGQAAPEPTSLAQFGVIALGAAGYCSRRRRK